MTDLHIRFRSFDELQPPDLWTEIERRAAATRRWPGSIDPAALIVAAVLIIATVWVVASIGSGGVGAPVQSILPGTSGCPSATPSQSARPSQTASAWTATGSMIEASDGYSATLLRDGTVLVAGGLRAAGDGIASAEIFDPCTGKWTATGRMIQGRGMHSASLLGDGTVLVTGGVSFAGGPGADVELDSAELYDPRTASWTVTGRMAAARTGGAATVLPDGRVLVAGGWGSAERFGPKLASAELYDPVSGTWTPTGSMTAPRDGHSATLLPNGTVLVAGGYVDSGRLASAELYDSLSGTWTATGSLPEPFLGHSDILLPNGTVLVSGGKVNGGREASTFKDAELYDPLTGTWTATGDMTLARSGHTATVLPDGRVLVAGGVTNGSGGDPVASAELYDPGR